MEGGFAGQGRAERRWKNGWKMGEKKGCKSRTRCIIIEFFYFLKIDYEIYSWNQANNTQPGVLGCCLCALELSVGGWQPHDSSCHATEGCRNLRKVFETVMSRSFLFLWSSRSIFRQAPRENQNAVFHDMLAF